MLSKITLTYIGEKTRAGRRWMLRQFSDEQLTIIATAVLEDFRANLWVDSYFRKEIIEEFADELERRFIEQTKFSRGSS